MNNEIPIATRTLNDLLDMLAENEDAQRKIYATYTRAAEVDLEMRDLKSKEKTIRSWMHIRIGGK